MVKLAASTAFEATLPDRLSLSTARLVSSVMALPALISSNVSINFTSYQSFLKVLFIYKFNNVAVLCLEVISSMVRKLNAADAGSC